MRFLLIVGLVASQCFATAGAKTNWQIQSTATAANANGGGFNWGNTHFPTDLACTSATGNAPICTSSSYSFISGDTNGLLFVQAGTNYNINCWYPITSVSGGAATINATIGAAVCVTTMKGLPPITYALSTVAGIATTASPTGGTYGVDYSQQNSAQFNATDLASTTGTTNPTTVTSSTHALGINWTGNIIHITAGTSWTQGWYEVVSVSGTTGTLDRQAGSAATISGGTYNLGGALSFNSTTSNQSDSNLLNGSHITGGQVFWIGSNVTTTSQNGTTAGSQQNPIMLLGYNSHRGDNPTGSTRPTLTINTTGYLNPASDWIVAFLIITGSTTNTPLTTATRDVVLYVKVTAAGGMNVGGSNAVILNNEIVAVNNAGVALIAAGNGHLIVGNYIHDSNWGLQAQSGYLTITNNIFAGNGTASNMALRCANCILQSNTIYGSEAQDGVSTGMSTLTGDYPIVVMNNITYGYATGIAAVDANSPYYENWNDYANNGTNYGTNSVVGPNDITVNPSFAGVAEVHSTAASSSSTGNVLTDSSANFGNVVNNQDFLRVVSGMTNAPFSCLVTAHTTTTLTCGGLTGSNFQTVSGTVAYSITTGHNFAVTAASVKGVGSPAFPGSGTTGYLSLGAVQPNSSSASNRAYVQ